MNKFSTLLITFILLSWCNAFAVEQAVTGIELVNIGNSTYISREDQGRPVNYRISACTEKDLFDVQASGNEYTITEKNPSSNYKAYYSTFFTTVEIPARESRIVTYTFDISQNTNYSSIGDVRSTYELFNYGSNISNPESIHEDVIFSIANNNNPSSIDYTVSRNNGTTPPSKVYCL